VQQCNEKIAAMQPFHIYSILSIVAPRQLPVSTFSRSYTELPSLLSLVISSEVGFHGRWPLFCSQQSRQEEKI
jgi:hypothetical protein